MTDPPRIELRSLAKTFRSGGRDLPILRNVDLTVVAGDSVAVLGPSGSGKSTLLALIAGLDRPTAGEVLLDGAPVHDLSEDRLALLRRRRIGFVFQSFQLLSNMTALENVMLPLELLRVARPRRAARDMLARVGLAEREHHYPAQLSGGEQQRVALARAFAPEPAVLLADEPTGNLDRATGEQVLALMADLRSRTGTTLVLVTHDLSAAERADRRLLLEDGQLRPASSVAEQAAGESL